MGKFLESLRQPAARRASDRAPAPPAPPTECDIEDDRAEEEIPYIEVGPHKSMEASASVLATRPMPASRPAVDEKPVATAVSFHPSPAETQARGPHFGAEVIAHHQPDHPVSEQYRELLACLIPPMAPEGVAALLLTPALPGADAATVLLNLAVTAARKGGRRVIVVDADLRQPTLAERLGLSARPGLSEVLAGTVTLEQSLQPTEQANLAILTAGGPAAAGPRLIVETPASLLRQVRQRCGLALILGPHWNDRPDGHALAAACDVVYLVLPEQEAGSPQVDELLQAIPRQGARLGGCILAAG
jgi:Mrp family chromosome partitioning ATPase